ncbi:DNA glycosylase [Coniella lustricola]|uniref:DNA-(apurinic or apyrimidinic site) lyase n=1 Tax=Coniella lustricola TaxID=2025994 RepID=A0A2T3A3L7_9PEZI|nr:DNA glycosylase [Coniella lustricola]
MTIAKTEWRKLPLSLTELCIDTTLRCGQSFRWKKLHDEWHCTLHGRIVSLKQDPQHLHYRIIWPDPAVPSTSVSSRTGAVPENAELDDSKALLQNYFNLHHDLHGLYKQWADADPNFRKKASGFMGVRILNQDAWEALVGFICSSNNNISRISQMVHNLCLHYGPYIGTIGDQAFHDFPSPDSLTADGVEAHLRQLGFGYRARYIAETARNIAQVRPAGWLQSLRNPDSVAWGSTVKPKQVEDERPTYKCAHESLLELCGVGPKVADCVCLMGLGWGEAVPVDTHVWQIALRDYKFGSKSKNKTLSKAMYDAVGDHFRNLWGLQAGWAHSVLFTADLKAFADQLAAQTKEKADTKPIKSEVMEEAVLTAPPLAPTTIPSKRKRAVKALSPHVKAETIEQDTSPSATTAILTAKRRRSQRVMGRK